MTDTLLAMIDAGAISLAHTRQELLAAIATILEAGAAAGDIRADVRPGDVSAGILAMLAVAPRSGDPDQSRRLLDLLMDGLRPHRSAADDPSR